MSTQSRNVRLVWESAQVHVRLLFKRSGGAHEREYRELDAEREVSGVAYLAVITCLARA